MHKHLADSGWENIEYAYLITDEQAEKLLMVYHDGSRVTFQYLDSDRSFIKLQYGTTMLYHKYEPEVPIEKKEEKEEEKKEEPA